MGADFEVNMNDSQKYLFNEKNLYGLSYNDNLKMYDLVLVDEHGIYVAFVNNCYLCAVEENPFGDVKEKDWYYPYAKFVMENQLMTGKGKTPDGGVKFDPGVKMTRAEFVQVLYSKEGKPDVKYKKTFEDVKGDVANDYNKYKEEKWLKKLRKKLNLTELLWMISLPNL